MGVLWRQNYYGQFGEDAVLQSIFREMAWRQASRDNAAKISKQIGFYVDIGAFAPIQHSNTYWFYRRGWRGINVDATPGSMRIFRRVRPRDINLEMAISSHAGSLTYYTWGVPNVMNTTSKEVAEQITRQGGQKPQETLIQARTLESVFNESLPSGQIIDFMTVDVENHNFEVIKSNNWSKYKPRVVLVEADNDSSSFEAILNAPMTVFMKSEGYEICAWVKPTIVFKLAGLD